jgi:putative transcriptional regulator
MHDNETVNNCVRELRTQKGITQEEFAEAVGVSRQTVIAIEKGNYVPSVLLALKIARFFEVKVEAVFSYSS